MSAGDHPVQVPNRDAPRIPLIDRRFERISAGNSGDGGETVAHAAGSPAAKSLQADAVFEGGGVKGIGLVGAVSVAEDRGYQWVNLAGTSAGAMVAALLAAGYTSADLKSILENQDFRDFFDSGPAGAVPVLGPLWNLAWDWGLFKGDALERWVRRLLRVKGVATFGDLVIDEFKDDDRYRYRLRVIAADLSRGKLLVLPQDIRDYGARPDDLAVARAVRMSAGIPFFFRPVRLTCRGRQGRGERNFVVDGGVLSNYPVWLFDTEGEPPWPTFGFKLVEPGEGRPNRVSGPLSLLTALFSTMLEAHDARYIEDHHFARTIAIPTLGIRTTEFGLSVEQKQQLFQSGVRAAEKFFAAWDFQGYVQKYRRAQ